MKKILVILLSLNSLILIAQCDTLNLPLISVQDVDICHGESAQLLSESGLSYLWNTGDTTQSISVSQEGDYYLSLL